jgi:hypothetical protein
MSIDIPPALVTAWAALISAITTPVVALLVFFMSRKLEKVAEQTDGMNKSMVKLADKAGHARGDKEATERGVAKAADLAEGQAQGRAEGDKRASDLLANQSDQK